MFVIVLCHCPMIMEYCVCDCIVFLSYDHGVLCL